MRIFVYGFMAFLAFCICFGSASAAETNQTIKTLFGKPFKSFNLSTYWELEDKDRSSVSFVHSADEDITFDFSSGNTLKSSATLDMLQKQIQLYAQGKAKTIPLIMESFIGSDDDEDEDEDDDDEDGLGFKLEDNLTRVVINGVEWINLQYNNSLETTTTSSQGSWTTTTALRETAYICLVKNRLYLAVFSAPSDSFAEYEPFFIETIANLY